MVMLVSKTVGKTRASGEKIVTDDHTRVIPSSEAEEPVSKVILFSTPSANLLPLKSKQEFYLQFFNVYDSVLYQG
jgi:hypothetical protein